MKKITFLLLAALCAVTAFAQSSTDVPDFECKMVTFNKYTVNPETVLAIVKINLSGDVVLPDSVEWEGSMHAVQAIGDDEYKNDYNSSSVISNEVTSIVIPNTVLYIGWGCFNRRSNLTSVTIGKNVKEIGKNAFSRTGLTSVVIPNSVIKIGDEAFYYCEKLASVTISKGVKVLGARAFGDCRSLKSITLPASIEDGGYQAFRYCSNLETVVLNSGKVRPEMFSGCFKLKSVTCRAAQPEKNIWQDTFPYSPNAVLKVPARSIAAYRANKNWGSNFGRVVAIPAGK